MFLQWKVFEQLRINLKTNVAPLTKAEKGNQSLCTWWLNKWHPGESTLSTKKLSEPSWWRLVFQYVEEGCWWGLDCCWQGGWKFRDRLWWLNRCKWSFFCWGGCFCRRRECTFPGLNYWHRHKNTIRSKGSFRYPFRTTTHLLGLRDRWFKLFWPCISLRAQIKSCSLKTGNPANMPLVSVNIIALKNKFHSYFWAIILEWIFISKKYVTQQKLNQQTQIKESTGGRHPKARARLWMNLGHFSLCFN